jgi:hypothetical protein
LQLGKHWDEVEVARDVARTRISRSSSFEQAIVLDVAMAGSPWVISTHTLIRLDVGVDDMAGRILRAVESEIVEIALQKAGCRIRTCALQEEVMIGLIRINRRNHLAKPAEVWAKKCMASISVIALAEDADAKRFATLLLRREGVTERVIEMDLVAGLEFEHELSVCLLSHLQRVRISTDLTVSSFQQESTFGGDSTVRWIIRS